MDVRGKLDEIYRLVEHARTVPLSASCVVNRSDLLAQLAELAGMLPRELGEAHRVLGEREAILEQGRAEAVKLMEAAKRDRETFIQGTDVYQAAQYAAQELRSTADAEAEALRRETDDYIDQKLAGFEISLQKTLASVLRARERLAGMHPPNGRNTVVTPEQRDVEQYITTKLGEFEQTLRKSLDTVSRGRERLLGRSGLDTLGVDENAPPLPT